MPTQVRTLSPAYESFIKQNFLQTLQPASLIAIAGTFTCSHKNKMAIKSKTKIENQLRPKTNKALVETIILAKKNPAWIKVAGLLTISRRKRKDINLTEIEKTEGKTFVVCGKVLSQGGITKKVKVVALSFSEKAKEKLKAAGCETLTIAEEIQKNKDAKEVIILQ